MSQAVGPMGSSTDVFQACGDLVGVVLAGGYSRRMGVDKGALPIAGQSAVGYLYALLGSVVGTVVVSVRPDQFEGTGGSSVTDFPCVIDDQPGRGPLGAILSVARRFPERPLLVAAVDLTGLTPAALARLTAARGPGLAAVAAQERVGPHFIPGAWDVRSARGLAAHPLCAVWEVWALVRARVAWQAGERSPRRVLAALETAIRGSVRLVDIPFIDANIPAEWPDPDPYFTD